MARFISPWRILILLPVVSLAALVLWARLAPRPKDFGVTEGRLAPCPDRPNCVCSQDTDAEHAIEPLPLTDSAEESLEALRGIVETMPRARIVKHEGNYLAAEFRSRFVGYIDDVEFYADSELGVVHIRSASRRGYSDLGVNRARMEAIRQTYTQRIIGPSKAIPRNGIESS